jgi:hypothetical protein
MMILNFGFQDLEVFSVMDVMVVVHGGGSWWWFMVVPRFP